MNPPDRKSDVATHREELSLLVIDACGSVAESAQAPDGSIGAGV